MFTRLSRRSRIAVFFSLFWLTAGAVASLLIPVANSAGGNSSTELVLQYVADNIMRLSVATNDIIYNPKDKMIYASRPSSVGSEGNSITRINPLTGEIVGAVYVGSEPNKLALSDDSQSLYVMLDGAYAIRRYDTVTQKPGIQFSVGRGQSVNASDAPYLASDIAVAPGNPDLLAVSRVIPGTSPPGAGVAIYKNGVRLPLTGPSHSGASNFIAFSTSAATLYGGGYDEGLRTMTVGENGVTNVTGNGTPFQVRKLKFENNLVFTSTGQIINPVTRTLLGTCPGVNTDAFVPDTATGRVLYAVKENYTDVTIKAFDINTFAQIGSLTVPNVGYDTFPTTLVRYGTNGLAMRTSDNKLYFIQTALLPTENPLPTPNGTPSATPTPSPTAYSKFIRSVALPNRDLIYSRTERKFYASVPSAAGTPRGNTVTRIEPMTGALENSVTVGSEPGRLALSEDDQTMYVGINGSNAVRKFDVQTQAPGLQFPLGSGTNGAKIAYDIDVLPGNPNSVAVSYGSSGYNYDGADIYDNGVKRAQKASASGQINIASPDTLYVGEYYVSKYGIGPNGLTQQGSFTTGGGESVLVGNLLYTAGGSVVDLNTLDIAGSFVGVGYYAGLTVDVSNNRIFFLANTSVGTPAWSIKAFRLDNFLPIGSIDLPGINIYNSYAESPHRLIRWGENGLAFNDYKDKIYFVQTDLISASATVPTALQLGSQTYSKDEDIGNVPVTIVRSGGVTGTTSLNYATQDGTATAGTDYTATAGMLTFAPGETSKTINVPVINDNVLEGNETFSFVLSSPGGDGTVEIQNSSRAVLTIVDNDNQPFASTPNITVNEPRIVGTSTALFTVQLTNPTIKSVTINYTTANGTARAGSDYLATSGTLTFAPLETTKTIPVQILADDNYNEPVETFAINFSYPVNVSINISQAAAFIINYNPQSVRHVPFDFDGDGRADIAVFRPLNGTWYVSNSSNNAFIATNFGQQGDVIAPADFDGDGRTDISVFRAGVWYRINSSTNQFVASQFGIAEDIPVPGDYDGDGFADIAVFRPSLGTWYYLKSSNNQFVGVQFGTNEDKPVIGDFDGDGKADLAVVRGTNGNLFWYWTASSTNQFNAVQFGLADDIATTADYDGDGKTDISVFRPANGTWYRLNSSQNQQFTGIQFGQNGDVPAAADYDGDGKADIGVFRSGIWYRMNSSSNSFYGEQFGVATDKPIPNAFVR
jgi:hypothetical protein